MNQKSKVRQLPWAELGGTRMLTFLIHGIAGLHLLGEVIPFALVTYLITALGHLGPLFSRPACPTQQLPATSHTWPGRT